MDKSNDSEKSGRENHEAAQVETRIPPLQLQTSHDLPEAEHYRLGELLQYHDRAFVIHTYAALTRGAPTTEQLANTLDDLRSGRRTKLEIIESLLATRSDGQPDVRVVGLPSNTARRVSRWPFIGYALRIFKGLARLPVLIHDQQRFEAYALAQQQHIADYINDVLAPAATGAMDSQITNLSRTVADAVESVLMLSDTIVDLSARHNELSTQLQAQLERLETRVLTELEQLRVQEAAQAEKQLQLEADLRAAIQAGQDQQRALEKMQREHAATAAAHQEFLIQEQRVIVETQKLVLGQLEANMRELLSEQTNKCSDLAAQVRSLQAAVEVIQSRYRGKQLPQRARANADKK